METLYHSSNPLHDVFEHSTPYDYLMCVILVLSVVGIAFWFTAVDEQRKERNR